LQPGAPSFGEQLSKVIVVADIKYILIFLMEITNSTIFKYI